MTVSKEPVDTVVRGAVVDVRSGRIKNQSIAIDDGEIVALDDLPAERELEANYITPGLIDAHMHVESSMVSIPQYGEAVVPRGVTSVVHDPHEIGNVLGEDGIRAAIHDAENTSLKVRFAIPSSVPASQLQDAGAEIDAEAVDRLLAEDKVVGLAEVMNIGGLVRGDEEVHAKIAAARKYGLVVDGHLPRVTGSQLQEAARFLDTDHESISLGEVQEKHDAGLHVYLRQGSTSHNLPDLVPLLEDIDSRFVSLCSDDRNIVDLLEEGTVDNAIRVAMREGVDPVEAVQLATLNTAERYGLPFGRIAPGVPADLVLLDDLESWSVDFVLIDGEIDPVTSADSSPPTTLDQDTVRFPSVSARDLAHTAPTTQAESQRVRVIDVGERQTYSMESEVPCDNGKLGANLEEDVLPAAVIDRHSGEKSIGTGFVHGLGLNRGAIASTIAHDAHNLVVVGCSHESMAILANHIRDIGGGLGSYDSQSDELTTFPLPVAGLMSDQPVGKAAKQFQAVESAAKDMGFDHPGGLMEITFLSLEVIPELRITNNGLVEPERMEYVDLIVQ